MVVFGTTLLCLLFPNIFLFLTPFNWRQSFVRFVPACCSMLFRNFNTSHRVLISQLISILRLLPSARRRWNCFENRIAVNSDSILIISGTFGPFHTNFTKHLETLNCNHRLYNHGSNNHSSFIQFSLLLLFWLFLLLLHAYTVIFLHIEPSL